MKWSEILPGEKELQKNLKTLLLRNLACMLKNFNITVESTVDDFAQYNKADWRWHRNHGFIAKGLYSFQISAWMEHFDPSTIYITTFEDWAKNEQAEVGKIFDFLQLPPPAINYQRLKKLVGHYDHPIMQDTKTLLCEFFAPFNKKLEQLLARQFHWYSCFSETLSAHN
eukprot:CAMPEP_0117858756 /NCGR_PEP_ID=MMETSP0950-20121206/2709_1 /TAXON_ID=44440 /ORGANISM="Chattonella subsalsa, Strain CCMP2191" /LENGTH=168 /DNA_ID=CAMNT_0005708463 /DNA_START=412 /DNA_END=915 /DNA_ORIENTATION=-